MARPAAAAGCAFEAPDDEDRLYELFAGLAQDVPDQYAQAPSASDGDRKAALTRSEPRRGEPCTSGEPHDLATMRRP